MSQWEHEELPTPPERRRLHHRTLDSERLARLRAAPCTVDDHSSISPNTEGGGGYGMRELVYCLKRPTGTRHSSAGTHGTWDNVYYLYGDERRAVRRAVEANTDYIASVFSQPAGNNAFASAWPDQLYQLLCEEWELYRRHGPR